MDFLDSGLSTRVSLEATHPVQQQQRQSKNSSWQLATGSWKLHLGPPVCNSSTRSQRGRQNFLITFLCGEGHVVISVRESTRYPSILLSPDGIDTSWFRSRIIKIPCNIFISCSWWWGNSKELCGLHWVCGQGGERREVWSVQRQLVAAHPCVTFLRRVNKMFMLRQVANGAEWWRRQLRS